MKKCLSGWQQHLKTAAPRPTTQRKMFGRTAIATRPTHTKWVGTTQGPAHTERAPTRGHEAENLGWRSPSLPRRVRGAAALPTPDDMPSEVLATGRGARWRWKRSSSPRRRRWKRSGPTVDPGHFSTSTDVFGANRGPRPSTDNPPHEKFPAMYTKGHILDSIILLI